MVFAFCGGLNLLGGGVLGFVVLSSTLFECGSARGVVALPGMVLVLLRAC